MIPILMPLERDILVWFIEQVKDPKTKAHLLEQMNNLSVIEREFTGVGVNVCFDISGVASDETSDRFEGPLIESPELETGATCDVIIDKNGRFDYIEVFSRAGYYPNGRHPEDYTLTAPPPVNYISLLEE